MRVQISQCLINSLFFAVQESGVLVFPVQNEQTNTDNTAKIIGSDMLNTFPTGLPCLYTFSVIEPAPTLTFRNTTKGSELSAHTVMQI